MSPSTSFRDAGGPGEIRRPTNNVGVSSECTLTDSTVMPFTLIQYILHLICYYIKVGKSIGYFLSLTGHFVIEYFISSWLM